MKTDVGGRHKYIKFSSDQVCGKLFQEVFMLTFLHVFCVLKYGIIEYQDQTKQDSTFSVFGLFLVVYLVLHNIKLVRLYEHWKYPDASVLKVTFITFILMAEVVAITCCTVLSGLS